MLILRDHSFLAHARLSHLRFHRGELSRRFRPAPWLDAKNSEIYGIALSRNYAIFSNHSVLLSSNDNLSRKQDERPLGIVHQNEGVHLRSGYSHSVQRPSHTAVLATNP